MTEREEGYRAGLEAAAKIVEGHEKPGDPINVALTLQLVAHRIRGLADNMQTPDLVRLLNWATQQR